MFRGALRTCCPHQRAAPLELRVKVSHTADTKTTIQHIYHRRNSFIPFQKCYNIQYVRPYDFRNAENMHRIAEYSHENEIYSITWDVMDFDKFLMNKSKVGLYT